MPSQTTYIQQPDITDDDDAEAILMDAVLQIQAARIDALEDRVSLMCRQWEERLGAVEEAMRAGARTRLPDTRTPESRVLEAIERHHAHTGRPIPRTELLHRVRPIRAAHLTEICAALVAKGEISTVTAIVSGGRPCQTYAPMPVVHDYDLWLASHTPEEMAEWEREDAAAKKEEEEEEDFDDEVFDDDDDVPQILN